MFFLIEQIFTFLKQENLGNFGRICFSSVSLTNFEIFEAEFTKIWTSQI
jgi:hypothetical protein